jgi:hypothetical protein
MAETRVDQCFQPLVSQNNGTYPRGDFLAGDSLFQSKDAFAHHNKKRFWV